VCARVGNQQSCGVVHVRVRTDDVQSLHHQCQDLHKSTYPVPLERSELILLSPLTPVEIVEADREIIVSAKSGSQQIANSVSHRKRICPQRVLRLRGLN
jgi:hypothetical protein